MKLELLATFNLWPHPWALNTPGLNKFWHHFHMIFPLQCSKHLQDGTPPLAPCSGRSWMTWRKLSRKYKKAPSSTALWMPTRLRSSACLRSHGFVHQPVTLWMRVWVRWWWTPLRTFPAVTYASYALSSGKYYPMGICSLWRLPVALPWSLRLP